MKNILAENMRRFHTKNLSEQHEDHLNEAPGVGPGAMQSWVNGYIKNHQFKLEGNDSGTRIYLSPASIKGRIELRVWNNLSDRNNDFIQISVLRQGIGMYSGRRRKEDTLYQKTIYGEDFAMADMPSVEGILKQYLPE
jgi:hypothetical protein